MADYSRLRFLLGLLLVLLGAGWGETARAEAPVIRDADSTVVIMLPEAWRLQPMSGVKNDIGVGNTYGDFAVNIYVTSERFAGTWEQYKKSNRELIEMMYKEFKVMEERLMTSNRGVPMVRLVARSNLKRDLQQFFYYGPGNGQTFFTVICTVPLEQGNKYSAVFDEVAEQIHVEGTHLDDGPAETGETEDQVITTIKELSEESEASGAEE